MMWRVIAPFNDAQDGLHAYQPGDIYPRLGVEVSEQRVRELLGAANRQGKALIEEIPDEEPEKKPKRRRRRAD